MRILRRIRGMRVRMQMTRERESQGLDDEGHGLGDEDQGLDYYIQGLKDEDLGLEEEEVIPEGQQQAFLVVETAASEPLELGYDLLGRHELAMEEYQPTLDTWVDPKDGRVYTDIPAYVPLYAPVQTSLSPEWSLGSLPVSPLSPATMQRELQEMRGHVTTLEQERSRREQ
nr:hypothetical protein [Tanacetum cinerariifolium]